MSVARVNKYPKLQTEITPVWKDLWKNLEDIQKHTDVISFHVLGIEKVSS